MKTTPRTIAFAVCSTFLSLASFSSAQIVVSYDCPDGDNFAPTAVATGVTATSLNATGSLLGNFSAGFALLNSVFAEVTAGSTTSALAVTNAQYFQFTISPPSGSKLNLVALVFQAARGGASTPRGWVVRSSQDGFATNLATADIPSENPTLTSFSTLLPSASFTGVAAPITFRIYTYAPAAVVGVFYDNIQALGIVDAPPVVAAASEKNVTTPKSRLRLTGVAFDDVKVAQVTVNGKVAQGTSSWRFNLRLKKRVTRVTILATDTGGLVSQPVKLKIRKTAS